MRHSLFYAIFFGFITGIAIHSFIEISFTFTFFLGLILCACMLYAYTSDNIFEKREVRQYSWFFIIAVFAIAITVGFIRYDFFSTWKGDPHLTSLVDRNVSLEGVVAEEPSLKETYTQLIVEITSISKNNIKPTKIIVYDDTYSDRKYGDVVEVKGKLQKPENFQSDNGRTFDYISYLAKDKIFYQIRSAKVSLVSEHQGNPIKNFMLSMKRAFISSLNRALPYPESRLAAGLVVAGKYALPKNIQQEFIDTGTIQVVVLSGYNVTIIAETIMLLLASLPKLFGATLGAVCIMLFTIAAGGSATIIRAMIMVLIALLGKSLRRKYDVGRALLVSATIMLTLNPMLLVFDPSFQLSFLATIGLIYFSPIVQQYLSFVPEKLNLRNTVASTTATQIFVTPFILYLTGKVSIVAFPANLALFLITPVTMLFSFITGIFGNIFVLFITPISFAAFLLLRSMLLIVHIFSRIPFASVSISSFPLWCTTLFYFGFAMIYFRYSKKRTPPLSKTRVSPS